MDQDSANARVKPAYPMQEHTRCQYPSKRCENPRCEKRNGELHNFCEFHRNKANFNQRRLEHKRKYQQEAPPAVVSLPHDVLDGVRSSSPISSDRLASLPANVLPATTLEPDDIWLLQELLKVEAENEDSDRNL
ncbi:unnamed protein product [Phytophthora fragariaefolia]|uniref:Unnamed protein product n=1 Tax=Phytophthora fragariaefolia TaxID=1490495 RepID=A0A9W6TNE1_9STRA|nr:unnamed protein product [Phytophthora fragariaefolia]